jgi:beta-N-acetylhexosaminidase
MTAHVYNKNLDEKYPATLSYNTITNLLRKKLSYNGVIISDDMQMGAIRENYSLKDAITLSLNAGVDMLIFSNQFGDEIDLQDIVDIVKKQIKAKKIKKSTIEQSYKRVSTLIDR